MQARQVNLHHTLSSMPLSMLLCALNLLLCRCVPTMFGIIVLDNVLVLLLSTVFYLLLGLNG